MKNWINRLLIRLGLRKAPVSPYMAAKVAAIAKITEELVIMSRSEK